MRKILNLMTVFVALATGTTVFAAQFTDGNIVVYRAGDGVATLTNQGNVVFLDEYTTNGTFVQSFMLRTNYFGAYSPLIGSGTAFGNGLITRSVDGRFILVNGYGATLGQFTNGSIQGNFASSVPRVTGLVDGQGNSDTTTVQTNSARDSVELRSTVSDDGTNIWTGGDGGGIRYQTRGSVSSIDVSSSIDNTRQLNILNNQLYFDINNPSGATQSFFVVSNTVANTLPMATNGVTNVVISAVTARGPQAFFMVKLNAGGAAPLDTLYIADSTDNEVEKYSLVSGTWQPNGSIAGIAVPVGLAGALRINGILTNVDLYISQGGATLSGGNNIAHATDTTGYNAAPDGGDLALIVHVGNPSPGWGPGKALRGIVMAPTTNSALALPSGAGRLSVGPAIDVFAKASTGCNNTTETNVYSLANPGTSSINWTATVNTAWVSLSPSNGTLASMGSANVIVTLGNITGLTAATNTAVITFSSAVGTTTRAVTLFLLPQEVTPQSPYIITGQPGGPFSPTNRNYTVVNGSTPITLAVSKTATWLNLSTTSVALPACGSVVISVSVNTNNANSLAAGIYADVISFSNATAGTLIDTRGANLTVGGVLFCDDFSTFTQNTAIEGQQGWAAASGSPSILVSNGAVYQPASTTANDEPYKNLPLMTNNVEFVYMAMSMMYTSAPDAEPVFGPTFYQGQNHTGFFRDELSARANNAGNTQFVFGARINNCGPWAYGTTPLNYNTPYKVIVRAGVIGQSNMVVWVNPPSATENTNTAYMVVVNTGNYCADNNIGSFQFGGQFTTGLISPGYAVFKCCITTNYAEAYNDVQPPPADAFSTWQNFYFGTTTGPAAGNADPDGDGMSNTNEFLAGFNPTNNAANLKITNVVTTDGTNVTITYLGASGDSNGSPGPKTNVLDVTTGTPPSYSNNFVSAGQTNVLTGGTGLGTVATFVHTNGATGPARYYRVRVLVP